jgi:hypothetical protein
VGLSRELNLLRRAIRERWKVPETSLDYLPMELERIALNADDDRNRVQAIRALVEMVKANHADDQTLLSAERNDLAREKFEVEKAALKRLEELENRADAVAELLSRPGRVPLAPPGAAGAGRECGPADAVPPRPDEPAGDGGLPAGFVADGLPAFSYPPG